jgi:hypothetical protein
MVNDGDDRSQDEDGRGMREEGEGRRKEGGGISVVDSHRKSAQFKRGDREDIRLADGGEQMSVTGV